jgi:hypothetical protein
MTCLPASALVEGRLRFNAVSEHCQLCQLFQDSREDTIPDSSYNDVFFNAANRTTCR